MQHKLSQKTVFDSCSTNPRVLLPCLGPVLAQRYSEILESVQKFAFRVCTKCWREPHNHLRNLLKLPLLKDRRKKLKLTVVYKCLNGLMVKPPNIFFPVNHSSWNLRSHGSIYLCISQLHTQIVIYIPLSQVLCLYGTNCLRTFTTVSPFLLLNALSITSIILFNTLLYIYIFLG